MSFGPMWTDVMCSHNVDLTEFTLQHSKELPLTVSYSIKNSREAAVTRLLSQVHRIQHLYVSDADDNVVADLVTAFSSQRGTPILSDLMLMSPTPSHPDDLDNLPVLDDRLFMVIPSSTTAILFTGKIRGLSASPPLPALTELSIVIHGPCSMSDIFALLRRIPNVRTLGLTPSSRVDIDQDSYDPVSLPRLRVFAWNGSPDLPRTFFRSVHVPKDLHLDLSYIIRDEDISRVFAFIRPHQIRQSLSLPCVSLIVNDSSRGDNLTRKGYIILNLHPSTELSSAQHTDDMAGLMGNSRPGMYFTCPYSLSDMETFHLMLGELFEALPVTEVQHFTLSVRFKEVPTEPLSLPALKELTGLTHLVLHSPTAIMTVVASMQAALDDNTTGQIIVPSLRHLHISGVHPNSPPDAEEDHPFDTLLNALTLRTERAVFLDTLLFTECGMHEDTVSRFRERAVAKEGVVWEAKATKKKDETP